MSVWPPLAEMMFGATTWCDRCNRTTLQCRNADDCHEPEPLPSSGVPRADRFFDAPAFVGHSYTTPRST